MTKPSTRTILALALAAVLVVAAAVAGIVAVAVHNAHEADPTVTAYAHGKTVTVPPYLYCTIGEPDPHGRVSPDCRRTEITAELNPPLGYPVQLSLPRHIADAPWVMVLEYQQIDNPGKTVQHLASYRDYPQGTLAVTVDSHPEPNLRLIGVEVQLLLLVRDEAGNEAFSPYQAWSIRAA
ncbi:hypothetical protein A5780_11190 [Nocardia sp. 852002-20019_SCH5090214]|uniref:DUF2771 domain-containing protein n=2 Tax=Nocardia TaxID=1817 RepID=A0A2S6A7J4_9NOCA|nr:MULTISPECIES: DUF2771 domain-containing protein [Nocardia]OBF69878.1 hypothetical protein A9X06_31635 [Mycobacterium sp. 852002-51759_SCH5129042]MBF6242446.1 DUF2771 domain-containing protein [Nocardia elegans]MBF6272209.1 DUF2771 domain-containing protein [Nocardia nova]MBF6446723.1 DUF2771 domain-containing protein [Nocardia elegans]OBA46198.1 hypothetical protein A5789_05270 [Nocardia sp. 852002-51101_SCH5132738]